MAVLDKKIEPIYPLLHLPKNDLFNWPVLLHLLLDVLKDETTIMVMDSCLKYHYVSEAIWVPCNDA